VSGTYADEAYEKVAAADPPPLQIALKRLDEQSVRYRKVIEILQMRLVPLVLNLPRATTTNDPGNGRDRDPQPSRAPLVENVEAIGRRLSEGTDILERLIESLAI
jgi:hypothetical protein